MKAGDRRCDILAAATGLFAEQGFHGTRTRERAERAGVSEALLFRHFPTKDALIRAILEGLRIQDQIDRLEAIAEDKPPREALEAIAEHLLTLVAREPQRMRLVFYAIMETPELGKEFYQRFVSRLLEIEARIFERARPARLASGSAPAEPRLLARSFHGTLIFTNLLVAV